MLPSHRPYILSHTKQGKTLRLDIVVLKYSEDKIIALGSQCDDMVKEELRQGVGLSGILRMN